MATEKLMNVRCFLFCCLVLAAFICVTKSDARSSPRSCMIELEDRHREM